MELIARIQALIRRCRVYDNADASDTTASSTIERCGLTLYTKCNNVSYDGRQLALTDKEYQILLLLISHPTKTFSTQNIFESVWMNRIHSFPITPLWFILKICAISLKPAVAVPTWLKQCGERDINLKNKFNGYKEYISSLLISFLIALLISIAVFTAIYLYGEKIINEYVNSDSYIYNTQAPYITSFQKICVWQ